MLFLENLKTEYAVNPLGIDASRPRFSWQLASDQTGQAQSAYEVLVASQESLLETDLADLWESGKVISGSQASIEYSGQPLHSGQRCAWKVRTWDLLDQVSDWSQPAWFEMGLLEPGDWLADWIGFPASASGKALYFRRDLPVEPGLLRARAYIAGLGLYELSINGTKIDDRVLEPAQTDTSKRIFYSVYDITPNLTTGQNIAGVIVGSGWHGSPRLFVQFQLDYPENRTVWIVSGCSSADGQILKGGWAVASGPILSNSLFDGEIYNACLETPGWDTVWGTANLAASPSTWIGPVVVEPPGGKLVPQVLEPIRVVDTLPAREIFQPKPDVFVFDIGQNMAGWALLKVTGERGRRVTLKFAESLYSDGTVNQENLRSALACDQYILKGGTEETWEPRFTYHGFRFIQVEGYPGVPGVDAVQARVVRSDVQPVGQFACDNELINSIHSLAWWTEASNLHGLPTDCPQRDERMGWLNDMTVRVEEALFNFDLVRLYEKWIDDITDAQDPLSGAITDTAPYRWGSRPADPVSASFLRAGWLLFRRYGNRRVLETHFKSYRKWVDYLTCRARNGILEYSYYGDWAPPVEEGVGGSIGSSAVSRLTPGPLVSTAFLIFSARLLSATAVVLGYKFEAEHYQQLAEQSAQAFHRTFWDPASGGYGSNNQACNVLVLYFNLVPTHLKEQVVAAVVQDIHSHADHLTTGNLCTRFLFDVLTETGHADLAYRLAIQTTYPSWGYMLENGATTVWERWEKETGGGMNSHNHPMYAAVDAWFYRSAGGLQPNDRLIPENSAFEMFTIHPVLAGLLRWGRASLQTVRGLVEVEWSLDELDCLALKAVIPVGSQAEIILPTVGRQPDKLVIDGITAWENGQLRSIKEWTITPVFVGGVAFRLIAGSGTHQIRLA